MNANTHRGIREAIRSRIVSGEWKLGELIPGEAEFAEQYGCSRTTVNRALQALAEEGIVERKRKGGTRVRPLPQAQAQFPITLVREDVEARGADYRCKVVERKVVGPPTDVGAMMRIGEMREAGYIETLHLADERPFAFENRWINLAAVPDFPDADFGELSVNEWLVRTVPFTRGDVAFCADAADVRTADILGTRVGDPLFTVYRTTWLEGMSVTTMTLRYAPGFRLEFAI